MLISVIVPIYNAEDTLRSCVESILAQSHTDIDVVLVNDGSTDNSGRICDDMAAVDARIRVFHQKNEGRSAARGAGVEHARGEWLSFVDADDTLPVDALQYLAAAIGEEVAIVLGNGYTLSQETRHQIPMKAFRHLAVRGEGQIGLPWGSLYHRSVMTPYLFDIPRHIMMGEDYIFWLRLVFTVDKPVNIVYKKVYHKGADHTSNGFHWTADYCQQLNELRKGAIPTEQYGTFLPDTIEDRLANLFAVAVCSPRKQWIHSVYYRDLINDIRTTGMRLPLRRRLFLQLPSIHLRRLYSYLSQRRLAKDSGDKMCQPSLFSRQCATC